MRKNLKTTIKEFTARKLPKLRKGNTPLSAKQKSELERHFAWEAKSGMVILGIFALICVTVFLCILTVLSRFVG